MDEPKYKRVLLKISGEALAGEKHFGLDFQVLGQVTDAIREQGNLCLGRTGVGFAFSVLLEDLYFFLRIQIHS